MRSEILMFAHLLIFNRMVKFIGMLSNGNLSQKAGDIGHHTQMVVFKCRRSEGSKIYFDLAIDDWPVTALNIRYD